MAKQEKDLQTMAAEHAQMLKDIEAEFVVRK